MHEIYCRGIENCARKYCQFMPVHGCIVRGSSMADSKFDTDEQHTENYDGPFYWCPIMEDMNPRRSLCPDLRTVGYRLYSKETEDSTLYRAVVEVLKKEDGKYCLFASRTFNKGDAIIFLSNTEQQIRRLFLGGECARRVKTNSNTYVTGSNALRCTRRIVKGEEIIRSISDCRVVDEYYERIDRVVLSPLDWKLGRIIGISGKRGDINNKLLVEYQDGSTESASRESPLGFCFRQVQKD